MQEVAEKWNRRGPETVRGKIAMGDSLSSAVESIFGGDATFTRHSVVIWPAHGPQDILSLRSPPFGWKKPFAKPRDAHRCAAGMICRRIIRASDHRSRFLVGDLRGRDAWLCTGY